MRIAHGNSGTIEHNLFLGHIIMLIIQHQTLVHKNIMVTIHRNFRSLKNGFTHIYLSRHNLSLLHLHFHSFDTGQGFDGNRVLIRQALVINKFCHATNAITAHFAFGAVSIEHAHFEISDIGFANANQSVTANAKTTMADVFGNRFRMWQLFLSAVHIYVIVASAVHFRELYFHGTASFRYYSYYYNINIPFYTS